MADARANAVGALVGYTPERRGRALAVAALVGYIPAAGASTPSDRLQGDFEPLQQLGQSLRIYSSSAPAAAAAPTIAAGSEPWGGGAGINSSDGDEWLLDGLPFPTPETGSSLTVDAADVPGAITRYDESTGLHSDPLPLQPIRGLTRNASTDDFVKGSAPAVPTTYTLWFEFEITGGDATYNTLCAWGDVYYSGDSNRQMIFARVNASTEQLEVLLYTGAASPTTTLVLTGITIARNTHYIMAIEVVGETAVTVRIGEPGGSRSNDTGTGPTGVAVSSGVELHAFGHDIDNDTVWARPSLGTMAIVAHSRATSNTEFDAVLAHAEGIRILRGDASQIWVMDAAASLDEGDTITTSADLFDTSFGPVDGTTRMSAGTLNTPTT